MRHDSHFVDQLIRPSGMPVGRMLPVEDLDPNPNQPRHEMGDMTELTASVQEKGLLEPIIVRPVGGRYQIIAGERRHKAAMEAGLSEVPCIVRACSDSEVMELALIENLQRKDLSPFEEAEGLKALAEQHGLTHEQMAERIGKSRTSITESMSLAGIPDEVRELCRLADISSKSVLLQILRKKDVHEMTAFIAQLQREGKTRQAARRIMKKEVEKKRGRPRSYSFVFKPKDKVFTLALKFRKGEVERDEIIAALKAVIADLTAMSSAS
jgi:ParB family chromosome partitioning protein